MAKTIYSKSTESGTFKNVAHKCFFKKIKPYLSQEDDCIIFKITLKGTGNRRYMFFQPKTAGFEDLEKSILKKLHISDIKAYELTTQNGVTVIEDDEDLYGAILEVNYGRVETKMEIQVAEKKKRTPSA